MKKTKEDYLKIVDETVKYYGEDLTRRAITNGNCEYFATDGRMCAVGRCTTNPKAVQKRWGSKNISAASKHFKINSSFKKEYRGFHHYFWRDLQQFHDWGENWDEKGISKRGLKSIAELKERINNNEYKI